MTKLNKAQLLVVLTLLLLNLPACIPGVQTIVQSPVFSVRGDLQVISFEPPLIGRGEVRLRLPLGVTNPNGFDAYLSRIDFDLIVNDRLAITSAFTEGIQLRANATSPLELDIVIPLSSGLALINDITALVSGQRTRVRLDGRVTLEVLGVLRVFARATLVSTQIH